MSYTGFPPNDFTSCPSHEVQQGNPHQHQSLLNQFPIPQYALPPSSRPTSYLAPPQSQLPPSTLSTTITSPYPLGPFPNPFPTSFQPVQFPVQFPQAPFPYAGVSVPAYGSLENIQHFTRQHTEPVQSNIRPGDNPVGHQQVLPTESLRQNSGTLSRRAQSVPANLTTIHPTLGLCVLVPISALNASASQSPGNWTAASTAGSNHRDQYGSRVDHLRRRRSRSRELDPYVRYTSRSPSRSFTPYVASPSSSVTVTPLPRHRRLDTPDAGRSPLRFHGIGGFTPLRSRDVPRPTIEGSVSTVGTCSQCGGTGASTPCEPPTDVSAMATPRSPREDGEVGYGEASRRHAEDRGSPVDGRGRFQASVVEVDE